MDLTRVHTFPAVDAENEFYGFDDPNRSQGNEGYSMGLVGLKTGNDQRNDPNTRSLGNDRLSRVGDPNTGSLGNEEFKGFGDTERQGKHRLSEFNEVDFSQMSDKEIMENTINFLLKIESDLENNKLNLIYLIK